MNGRFQWATVRSLSDIARAFWAKVDKTGPAPAYKPDLGSCWLWEAGTSGRIGRLSMSRRRIPAHWFLVGPPPPGMVWKHLCGVGRCVRPDHLAAVTRGVGSYSELGVERTAERRKGKTGCVNGHPYDKANAYLKPDGSRECRICKLEEHRRYNQRQAEARNLAALQEEEHVV
jgi:hypothetical protein